MAFGLPKNDDLPSFEWVGDLSEEDVPLLKISFADGGDDDVAILMPFNPIPQGPTERADNIDNCIFHGFLENEKDVYVTVTGCPESNNFEVNTYIFFN